VHKTLIVARIKPDANEQDIAEIFAASDETELPEMAGVSARTLFRFHDLYMHLIESDDQVGTAVDAVRDHPLFRQVSQDLARYVEAYDPATWRGPSDAMARPFYRWTAT
jgi:cyclase